jgi:hypothetical protein
MHLEQVSGAGTGRRIPIAPGQNTEIGRATAVSLGIAADPSMSARHFAVTCEDAQCRIRDLGSTNGTFVNGVQITEAILREGDRIEAGDVTFVARLTRDGTARIGMGQRASTTVPVLEFANDTPLSVTTIRWSDLDDKPKLTVIAKATFGIPAPGETVHLSPRQLPIFEADIMTKGSPPAVAFETDRVPFKPCTDIVLVGCAHAPDDKPVSQVIAGVRVAQVRHAVAVFGDRRWETQRLGVLTTSAAQPFLTMDLVYERAFGGFDEPAGMYCAENHIGTGYVGKRSDARLEGLRLPNLEDPRDLIRAWDSRPRPAGFGFYGRGWAPRLAYLGTYDERYMSERHPRIPSDFSYRFFNGAHPDLQVGSHLRGDEDVELVNVCPGASRVHFCLPGLVPKITIERWMVPPEQWIQERVTAGASVSSDLPLEEESLVAALDTLVFVPERGVFYEVFRAVCDLSSLESLEIARVKVTR